MQKVARKFFSYCSFANKFLLQNYYRFMLSCPKNVLFLGKIKFYNPEKISIGHNVRFNDGVFLNIGKSLIIEDDVTLSANVFITDTTSDINRLPKHFHVREPVLIRKNAFFEIAVVLPDCSIMNNRSN